MTDTADLDELARWLESAVSRLAEPPVQQGRHLDQLGIEDVDELALEFSDAWSPARWRLQEAGLPEACTTALENLDEALSSDTLGWSRDDLNSPEWQKVRALATDAAVRLRDWSSAQGWRP